MSLSLSLLGFSLSLSAHGLPAVEEEEGSWRRYVLWGLAGAGAVAALAALAAHVREEAEETPEQLFDRCFAGQEQPVDVIKVPQVAGCRKSQGVASCPMARSSCWPLAPLVGGRSPMTSLRCGSWRKAQSQFYTC